MRPVPNGEIGGWRRASSAAVLLVVGVLVGAGVALVVAGRALGMRITVVGHGAGGRPSRHAPGVALGAELIAVAILVAGRAGARIPMDKDEVP